MLKGIAMNSKKRILSHLLILGAAVWCGISFNSASAATTSAPTAAVAPVVTPNQAAAPAPLAPPTLNTPSASINPPAPTPTPTPMAAQPQSTPPAPTVNAKAYILIDAYSGQVLAAQNADLRVPPASLTKIMTSYLISDALRVGRIHPADMVTISEKAWRTGGSKMFIKIGNQVPVEALVQGIIVQSGNDACVAMAEHIAGSEEAFANLMNQQAALIGMKSTHFTDANGLPNPNHYTTARDMSLLARALVLNFPEDYKWYSQKWFLYNGIKQPNRNRLLWRDPTVDGIKTGHTDDAGFCLVASAIRNNMRLISVVMGAPSDSARADDSAILLNYGFRFFESHALFTANTAVGQARVWFGEDKKVSVGTLQNVFVTVPVGQFNQIKVATHIDQPLRAPILRGQTIGTAEITLNNKVLVTQPLVALKTDNKGGFFSSLSDHIRLAARSLLGGDKNA